MIDFKDKQQVSNYKFVVNYVKFNDNWENNNSVEKLENQLRTVREDKVFIKWKITQHSIDRVRDTIEFLSGVIQQQQDYLHNREVNVNKFKNEVNNKVDYSQMPGTFCFLRKR